jgi:hypothetical protein
MRDAVTVHLKAAAQVRPAEHRREPTGARRGQEKTGEMVGAIAAAQPQHL